MLKNSVFKCFNCKYNLTFSINWSWFFLSWYKFISVTQYSCIFPILRKYSHRRHPLQLQRVLLLQKLSRLQIEQLRNSDLSENELKTLIIARGTDYEALQKHDNLNRQFQVQVLEAFQKYNIECVAVNRWVLITQDQEILNSDWNGFYRYPHTLYTSYLS